MSKDMSIAEKNSNFYAGMNDSLHQGFGAQYRMVQKVASSVLTERHQTPNMLGGGDDRCIYCWLPNTADFPANWEMSRTLNGHLLPIEEYDLVRNCNIPSTIHFRPSHPLTIHQPFSWTSSFT